MAVIGFLRYSDFLAELKSVPLWGEPIRVQQYHKSVAVDKKLPIKWVTFYVEAAIYLFDSSHTLVCRFVTGKTNTISYGGPDQNDKLEKLDRRNRRAANILRQALEESEGFTVRPGLIAAAAESQTEADPQGLWTADDLSLEETKE